MKLRVRPLRILLAVGIFAALAYGFRGEVVNFVFLRPQTPPGPQQGLRREDVREEDVTVVADGLDVPWALAFLPDGSLLVTERPGRLVRIAEDGDRRSYAIDGVRHAGEGGLMGLTLHPDFAATGWIYVCLTAEDEAGFENRVERYRLDEERLGERKVIIDAIPAASFHNGCRLGFGPDGYLYVTTGDAGSPRRSQDRRSLAGKILRLTADGEVPSDNPFAGPAYSYGHRNPQGLAWDERGRLWSTEHGRSGGGSGFDELNIVERGNNYGWPEIEGDETAPGMKPPVLHSGPSYTWAPSGAAYLDGRVFFGGLRGEALYEARIRGNRAAELRAHFQGEFGRIRAVRAGPDGFLYFSTSNRDGRGRRRSGDDKIVQVNPAVFR